MSSIQKVSRDQLYDSQPESEDELILPDLEFEIIENDPTHPTETITTEQPQQEEQPQEEEAEDEFDFPLFSFGGSITTEDANENDNDEAKDEEERGRPKVITQKISLREPTPEKIIQSRPESYYFQRYTEEDHAKFESAAVSYEDILKHNTERNHYGKVWDLTEYNNKIERQIARDTRKKGRPGKKARLAKRVAKENEKQRDKIKKLEKQREMKKLMKKIHHKRGGKKNKKKGAAGSEKATGGAPDKPKYRTE